jgi:hypothetical protein
VVLDDAALAYLAAHGNRQMDGTMSVLLPFSSTNPYVSKKRGLVAEEMFYGRDAERKSVLDPDGTQLMYGGRGLGKSALLRSAGQLFEAQGSPGERVSLYLSLDTVGIRAGSAIGPDAIWNALLRDLTDHGVIAPPTRASRRTNTKPHEQVRSGVLAWLDDDPRRRLLILLDESDRFFESDAPEFFETNRLKELSLTTDGRIKVVFAGLHSVQRYAKSARNGPARPFPPPSRCLRARAAAVPVLCGGQAHRHYGPTPRPRGLTRLPVLLREQDQTVTLQSVGGRSGRLQPTSRAGTRIRGLVCITPAHVGLRHRPLSE